MNMESKPPENLIRRPDGSYVDLAELEPRKQLAHDLVGVLFAVAEEESSRLIALKSRALREIRAYRDMMMDDYGIQVGGAEGGITLRSVCGTMMVKLDINKQTSFGPELNAAKALLDEWMESRLEGSTEEIRAILEDVFKPNKKGRLDTARILGLRKHKFTQPLWLQAMDAIEDAIIRDNATTYIRFYRVDTDRKAETLLPLDLAKV